MWDLQERYLPKKIIKMRDNIHFGRRVGVDVAEVHLPLAELTKNWPNIDGTPHNA